MIVLTNPLQLENHITLTACAEINALVEPFLKKHGITFFNFHKEFYDGGVIRLSNRPDWTAHYFSQGYIQETAQQGNNSSVKNTIFPQNKLINFYLWHINDWPVCFQDAEQNFNICYGISVVKRALDGIESYGFATTKDNHQIINNVYLQNLDWLADFCDFFKTQAAPLIKFCTEHKIIIPASYEKTLATYTPPSIKPGLLSKKQLTCAFLLLEGMTIKQIARQLNLSPRTVETHVNIIKDKLGCTNKSELVLKLHELLRNSY